MSRDRFIRTTLASVGAGSRLTLADAARMAAQEFGVTIADIMGKRRFRKSVHARQEAMRLANAANDYSLSQIGKFFDRDPTTVLHGIKAATERKRQC